MNYTALLHKSSTPAQVNREVNFNLRVEQLALSDTLRTYSTRVFLTFLDQSRPT